MLVNKVYQSKILFQHKSLSVLPCVRPCVQRLTPFPAGESQNVTNKSGYICLRGDKNALRVHLMTPGVPDAPENSMYLRTE